MREPSTTAQLKQQLQHSSLHLDMIWIVFNTTYQNQTLAAPTPRLLSSCNSAASATPATPSARNQSQSITINRKAIFAITLHSKQPVHRLLATDYIARQLQGSTCFWNTMHVITQQFYACIPSSSHTFKAGNDVPADLRLPHCILRINNRFTVIIITQTILAF